MHESRNLAARAAHSSAQHCKKAIFGWLVFPRFPRRAGSLAKGQQ
jgi:hypothetical protein